MFRILLFAVCLVLLTGCFTTMTEVSIKDSPGSQVVFNQPISDDDEGTLQASQGGGTTGGSGLYDGGQDAALPGLQGSASVDDASAGRRLRFDGQPLRILPTEE